MLTLFNPRSLLSEIHETLNHKGPATALGLLNQYQALLAREPNFYLIKAKILTSLHQHEAALIELQTYDEMKQHRLERPKTYIYAKSRALICLERHEEALALLNTINDAYKNYTQKAYAIRCLLELNNLTQASQYFLSLKDEFSQCPYKQDPGADAAICHSFSIYFMKQGDEQQALAWVEQALHHHPTDPTSIDTLAEISAYFCNEQKLNQACQKLLETTRAIPKTHLYYAKYFAYQGRLPEAENEMRAYVRIRGSWDVNAYVYMASCQEIVGNHVGAAHYYKLGTTQYPASFNLRQKARQHQARHPGLYVAPPLPLTPHTTYVQRSTPYPFLQAMHSQEHLSHFLFPQQLPPSNAVYYRYPHPQAHPAHRCGFFAIGPQSFYPTPPYPHGTQETHRERQHMPS